MDLSSARWRICTLWSFDPVKCECELAGGHNAQVGLEAACEPDACLGVALGRDLTDGVPPCEPLDDRTHVVRGDDEIKVADGLHATAQAPRRLRPLDLRQQPQTLQDGLRRFVRIPPEVAPRVGLPITDACQDILLGLRPEAGQGRHPALPARLFKLGDGGDAKLAAHRGDLLWPQARDLQHLHEPGLDRGLQLVEEF
jgi:hypothetical protein